jgi:hypothetical protein
MTAQPIEALDERAWRRMKPFLRRALDAQDAHVRDQLEAAMADGRVTHRVEDDVFVGAVVVVVVDGYALASFALDDLLADDSPLDDEPPATS